jgi:hypothetical protein
VTSLSGRRLCCVVGEILTIIPAGRSVSYGRTRAVYHARLGRPTCLLVAPEVKGEPVWGPYPHMDALLRNCYAAVAPGILTSWA